MNGRIYDPLIGRFLSADVIVDGPMSLQGYNRYSYVKNNPLTYWDPNGYQKGRKYTEKQLASMRARRNAFNNSGVGMIYNGVGQVAINFVPWAGDIVGTAQDVNDVANGSTTDKTIGSASLALNAWTLGASPGLSGIKNGGKSIFNGVLKLFGKGANDAVDAASAASNSVNAVSDAVNGTSDAVRTVDNAAVETGNATGVVPQSIETPYGTAFQSDDAASLTALDEVQSGATVYRQGNFEIQKTSDGQFWSLDNPAQTPDFANNMGMPDGSDTPDWIMGGTVEPDGPVITRPAPGLDTNAGGNIEAVVPENGVKNVWFYMPDDPN